MNTEELSDREICAFADRRLNATDTARIASQVDADPQLAARINDWRRQDAALHKAFDPVLNEAVPPRLLEAAAGHSPVQRSGRGAPLRWAAAIGWLTVGALAGYGVRDHSANNEMHVLASLPRQAAIAHAVYVPEVRHPVEVGADQQAHLVGWLTKRLGTDVRTPDLQQQGYALVGGRLLPSAEGPSAQLMYQDAAGQRLTLYLSRNAATDSTAFRYAREDDVSVFYWVDGGTGYALSAKLPREALLAVANTVYAQFNP